jgi:hypothetical protein
MTVHRELITTRPSTYSTQKPNVTCAAKRFAMGAVSVEAGKVPIDVFPGIDEDGRPHRPRSLNA